MVSSLIDSEVFTVSGNNSMSGLNYINASVLPLNRNRTVEDRYCCPMILCYDKKQTRKQKIVFQRKTVVKCFNKYVDFEQVKLM